MTSIIPHGYLLTPERHLRLEMMYDLINRFLFTTGRNLRTIHCSREFLIPFLDEPGDTAENLMVLWCGIELIFEPAFKGIMVAAK